VDYKASRLEPCLGVERGRWKTEFLRYDCNVQTIVSGNNVIMVERHGFNGNEEGPGRGRVSETSLLMFWVKCGVLGGWK
jgi:hypothetical protein